MLRSAVATLFVLTAILTSIACFLEPKKEAKRQCITRHTLIPQFPAGPGLSQRLSSTHKLTDKVTKSQRRRRDVCVPLVPFQQSNDPLQWNRRSNVIETAADRSDKGTIASPPIRSCEECLDSFLWIGTGVPEASEWRDRNGRERERERERGCRWKRMQRGWTTRALTIWER
jgi:hypothetical protein